MINPFFNCFLLDLTVFNSRLEIEDFLRGHGLLDKIDHKNLWNSRKGKYTGGKPVTKMWFDTVTYHVIAYAHYNEQHFTQEYIRFLSNMTPLEMNTNFNIDEPIEEKELTVDNILDKIRINGVESLTTEEKKFLESI